MCVLNGLEMITKEPARCECYGSMRQVFTHSVRPTLSAAPSHVSRLPDWPLENQWTLED